MDDVRNESMVTITLGEYNELRDIARRQDFIFERLSAFENRMMDMDRRINDLSIRKADK